jgi:hypothetical protein
MPTEVPSNELPETLFMPPSRARWVFAVALSVVIVGTNFFVASTQEAPALAILAAIFSFTGLAAGIQLVPGSAGLWLDRQGFTFRMFWYDRRREWKEITPILSSQVGLLQMVGFNRASDKPNQPREVLPDTYGISANELAELMNHWRDTAIKAG